MKPILVLSLFPGIDLLGRGFEQEGFCVVRGPDLIWGQPIETFHVPPGIFAGVIAGTPCQSFSKANRTGHSKWDGDSAIEQFKRLVTEAFPDWWLVENVPTVPDITIEPYIVQRLDIRATDCGLTQRRLRHIQFATLDGSQLVPQRVTELAVPTPAESLLDKSHRCCLATEGTKANRRSFPDFCELQGLPRDFDLPGWPRQFKYAAVGNGVPIPMAAVLARGIRNRGESHHLELCACKCGRPITGNQKTATPACRKRLQRRRDRLTAHSPSGAGTL